MLLRRHKNTLQKRINPPADIDPQGGILSETSVGQLPFSDTDIEFETQPNKRYTKTDINKLNTAELQELAATEGIENAFETSGQDLKKILIEHFNL